MEIVVPWKVGVGAITLKGQEGESLLVTSDDNIGDYREQVITFKTTKGTPEQVKELLVKQNKAELFNFTINIRDFNDFIEEDIDYGLANSIYQDILEYGMSIYPTKESLSNYTISIFDKLNNLLQSKVTTETGSAEFLQIQKINLFKINITKGDYSKDFLINPRNIVENLTFYINYNN